MIIQVCSWQIGGTCRVWLIPDKRVSSGFCLPQATDRVCRPERRALDISGLHEQQWNWQDARDKKSGEWKTGTSEHLFGCESELQEADSFTCCFSTDRHFVPAFVQADQKLRARRSHGPVSLLRQLFFHWGHEMFSLQPWVWEKQETVVTWRIHLCVVCVCDIKVAPYGGSVICGRWCCDVAALDNCPWIYLHDSALRDS